MPNMAISLVQQRARMEDALLQSTQMAAALPAAVGAYKNHPLYVLERHLGKVRGARPCCAGRNIPCLGNLDMICNICDGRDSICSGRSCTRNASRWGL
jgi:hypothetical protein